MSDTVQISAAEVYARVSEALVANAAIETSLLTDFGGTLKSQFGIEMPGPATLARTAEGFRLRWSGRDYDIGDPRNAGRGELNDAELELVSGGADSCQADADQARRNAEKLGDFIKSTAERFK